MKLTFLLKLRKKFQSIKNIVSSICLPGVHVREEPLRHHCVVFFFNDDISNRLRRSCGQRYIASELAHHGHAHLRVVRYIQGWKKLYRLKCHQSYYFGEQVTNTEKNKLQLQRNVRLYLKIYFFDFRFKTFKRRSRIFRRNLISHILRILMPMLDLLNFYRPNLNVTSLFSFLELTVCLSTFFI